MLPFKRVETDHEVNKTIRNSFPFKEVVHLNLLWSIYKWPLNFIKTNTINTVNEKLKNTFQTNILEREKRWFYLKGIIIPLIDT